MAYAIYTAVVKNCCTACTAVHASRTVLLNSTIQSITVRWFLFLYQVYSTTVVLPVLGVLSFFCFRCSYKTAVVLYSSTECFFRLNLISSSIYFVLNFELVVIYRGLLQRSSTIGEGGDTTISSLGRSPKQPLPGMRLHDPLHGWSASLPRIHRI